MLFGLAEEAAHLENQFGINLEDLMSFIAHFTGKILTFLTGL